MAANITDINEYRERKQSKAIRDEMEDLCQNYGLPRSGWLLCDGQNGTPKYMLTPEEIAESKRQAVDPDIITNMTPEELAIFGIIIEAVAPCSLEVKQ